MKKIILMYFLIALSLSCVAQSNLPTNVKDILLSKDWVINGTGSQEYTITFTNTKMSTFSAGVIIGEDEYYISNNLDECSTNGFIHSNIGVSNVGKYIITENFCLEIITISSTRFKFKNLKLNTYMSATPK